jgi:hypothetical protein
MWHPALSASAACVRSPRRARPAGGDRGHIPTAGGARTVLLAAPPRSVHQPPPGSAGARLAAGAAGGGKGRLIFLYSERLNGKRYAENWLENLLVSGSMNGVQQDPQNPL